MWVSDVRRAAVAEGVIGEGEPLDVGSEPFKKVLDEVIDQRLVAREAQAQHLDRDPVVKRNLSAAHDKVMGDALIDREINRAVNETAIRQLYNEQQKKQKTGEEFHARQIVLATQADAEAVKKLLLTGGQFDALAMQRSTDQATKFGGGDLGWFTPDSMAEPWAAVLKGRQARRDPRPLPDRRRLDRGQAGGAPPRNADLHGGGAPADRALPHLRSDQGSAAAAAHPYQGAAAGEGRAGREGAGFGSACRCASKALIGIARPSASASRDRAPWLGAVPPISRASPRMRGPRLHPLRGWLRKAQRVWIPACAGKLGK